MERKIIKPKKDFHKTVKSTFYSKIPVASRVKTQQDIENKVFKNS